MPSSSSEIAPREAEKWASDLARATAERTPLATLTAARPFLSLKAAYAIQQAGVRRREAEAARVIGYKLGFTSKAKQVAMQIHAPIYGTLLEPMRLSAEQALSLAPYIHPKVEPEIAFILRQALCGPAVTAQEVLSATASIHPALDVLDSRYRDFKFQLADVIADNASGAAFVLGPAVEQLDELDLAALKAEFYLNGRLVSQGTGRDVMGHPAEAVAWLARALHASGGELPAGAVVLSGSLVAPISASAGDVFEARIERLGRVMLRVEPGGS